MKKRWLAIGLTAAMITSMAACGGSSSTASKAESKPAVSPQRQSPNRLLSPKLLQSPRQSPNRLQQATKARSLTLKYGMMSSSTA